MRKKELLELLEKLFGSVSGLVVKQIDNFVAEGHTYKSIARAVYYLFDVQKRDIKTVEKFGIGLVPFYIDVANKYYDDIKKQYEKQKQQLENLREIEVKEVEPMQRKKKERNIDINDL